MSTMMQKLESGVELAGLMGQAGRGLVRAGVIAPVRPDRLVRLAWRVLREGPSLATALTQAACRFPERRVVVDDAGDLTYVELDRQVQAIAAALAGDGVGPGTTVALMCRNHRGFIAGLLAVSRLGADIVLLNTEFPAPQLQQVLARHALVLAIHDAEFLSVFAKAGYAGQQVLADTVGLTEQPAFDTLDTLALRGGPTPGPHRQGQVIILTSGTTGVPKGAPRKSQPLAFVGPAATLFETLPLHSGEPVLVGPPLFHGFGFAFMALGLVLGSPLVLTRRFDPDRIAQRLVEYQVKTFVVVPVMLQRLLDIPAVGRFSWSFRHLTTVISAGAPLSAALATRWMDTHGDNLFNLYGSTETGFGTLATPADMRAAPGTVGRIPLGTSLQVLDDAGQPVPPGQTGHICLRSGMLFEGYVGGGSKPMLNGYMNSGDIGHVDADGRVFVEGREDDMIVSGGENVFPQEVEEMLAGHQGVADVAVIGVADPEFGQRLVAFVVRQQAVDVNEEMLKVFLKGQIARYKVPRDIVFLSELPRNPTGKILRRQLALLPTG